MSSRMTKYPRICNNHRDLYRHNSRKPAVPNHRDRFYDDLFDNIYIYTCIAIIITSIVSNALKKFNQFN